ncbi:MAG: ribosome assembly RNA-binding protein YhbY [Thiotrichales bacterium]|nr:MAG: ribosome assembly RNA-binding protein YhbY [Thiotrichales bacterium]
MSLSKNQIKFLKGRCHDLKPVVMLGQKGLTDAVLNELDIALDHHELIKVRLSVDDRDARKQITDDICQHCQAQLVQSIGKTVSIFRPNPKQPVIQLPKE